MKTIEKRGEIKSFTDQVRVICVKNNIDKPNLGKKIGMDCDFVFTAIKNNTFKPDPETYFRLESYICGKDAHYKSKLRSKYEKTLTMAEMSDYMKASQELNKTNNKPKNVAEAPVKEEKELNTESMTSKPKVDIEARKKMYRLIKDNTDLATPTIDKLLGHKYMAHLAEGKSRIPPKDLKKLLKHIGIHRESELYKEIVELELDCIAGLHERKDFDEYANVFGDIVNGKTTETKDVTDVPETETDTETETEEINKVDMRHKFSEVLVKWLFMNGYTLKQAARSIGCSEMEFKDVASGKSCLSPYHVNRFKETLRMDDNTIEELVKMSNACYEGHEIPESILSYISSDVTIINALTEIVRQNKGAAFWDAIWKEL